MHTPAKDPMLTADDAEEASDSTSEKQLIGYSSPRMLAVLTYPRIQQHAAYQAAGLTCHCNALRCRRPVPPVCKYFGCCM